MFLSNDIRTFLRPVLGWLAAVAASAIVASAFSIGVAFGLAATLSSLLRWADGPPAGFIATLLLTAACAAGRAGALWLRDQLGVKAAAQVKRSVRRRVMDKLYELGPGYAWPGGRGAVQPTIVDGIEHLQGYLGFYLPQLVVSWVVPAALLLVLAFVDPPVALVVLFFVLLVPFARHLWRWALRNRAQDHWDRYAAFADRLGDTIRGLPTLVALGATGRRRRLLAEEAEHLRAATTANMGVSLGVSAIMATAIALGTSGATLVAAYDAARGTLPLESVLLVLFLAAECFRPQQDLSAYWHEGFYGIAAVAALSRLLNERPPVVDPPGALPASGLDAAPSLSVEGVSLTFPGAGQPALLDVSFRLPAGATLAVVGASGAGKTTLGRLLLRDLDPDQGRILLGGHDLRLLPLAQLRRLGARVSQDVVLLSGTIHENIAHAAALPPGADRDARVADAVDRAQVSEVAAQLDRGLGSQVGEHGRLLSGGQRQRVALARALVADARLLLDEATSALDAENEALITEVLRAERGTRTMVVIAHRLSTVAHADYVLVLEGGRVAEFGPPAELAAAGGHWAALLAAQRRGQPPTGPASGGEAAP